MKNFKVKIVGKKLLQHRFPVEEQIGNVGKSVRGVNPSYVDAAETAKYKLDDGTIYQPAISILKAIEKAATNIKIPGKRGKSYKDLFRIGASIDPECIPRSTPLQ